MSKMSSGCTMEYYSALKKMEIDTGYNVDEPGGHYAQRKKPDTKGQILHDATD